MAKKTSGNAMKKIDKQLDILLKDKKQIEDIPIIDRREIINKAKEEKKKTTKKKKEAIVAPTRKKAIQKKEAIVVQERKRTSQKKKSNKKGYQAKKIVSESTIKMQQLESQIRSLYDKVNDVVEDIEMQKTVENNADVVITDIIVKDKKEKPKKTKIKKEKYNKKEEIVEKVGLNLLDKITIFLLVIFLLMFIAFILFIFYVCTY